MKKIILATVTMLFWTAGYAPLQSAPGERAVPYHVAVLMCPTSRALFSLFRSEFDKLYPPGGDVVFTILEPKNEDHVGADAQKLVDLKPDLIITTCYMTTKPVYELTKGTDQKVFFLTGAPLRSMDKLMASRSNMSGATYDVEGTLLDTFGLLKDMLPSFSRVAVLSSKLQDNEFTRAFAGMMETTYRQAAKKYSLTVDQFLVKNERDVKNVLAEKIGKGRYDVLICSRGVPTKAIQASIVPYALEAKMPTLTTDARMVEEGILLYFDSQKDGLMAEAAASVQRILQGENPVQIPILKPAGYSCRLNMRTAQVIGLAIPNHVLQRSEQVN